MPVASAEDQEGGGQGVGLGRSHGVGASKFGGVHIHALEKGCHFSEGLLFQIVSF